MKCPFCDYFDTQVRDSRPFNDFSQIKRRRFCSSCSGKFTTYERFEDKDLKVIKRSGQIKPLDQEKIFKSLELATRKLSINSETLHQIMFNIMKKIRKLGETDIHSNMIGKIVMEELIKTDEVAYVRYASVYMEFRKAEDFSGFIKNMLTKT